MSSYAQKLAEAKAYLQSRKKYRRDPDCAFVSTPASKTDVLETINQYLRENGYGYELRRRRYP